YDALGLLQIDSKFTRYKKTTRLITAEVTGKGPMLGQATGRRITAYEIHMGDTKVSEDDRPFKVIPKNKGIESHPEGAVSGDGIVFGSYLHGLFDNESITHAIHKYLAGKKGVTIGREINVDKTWRGNLDLLCRTVMENVEMDKVLRMAGIKTPKAYADLIT
ncbi:MAG TPA: hypothetical protein VK503_06625, partial [Candidatus Bathyarchaeia archaeon]|nr:hypothetical protein [Candidatus Bathyarchaeia archaeon]